MYVYIHGEREKEKGRMTTKDSFTAKDVEAVKELSFSALWYILFCIRVSLLLVAKFDNTNILLKLSPPPPPSLPPTMSNNVLAFQAVRTARTKALDIFENAFTNLKKTTSSTTFCNNNLVNNDNKTREMVISRLALPFQSDKELREEYVNHLGDLRLGLLLEDADALCGFAAYKHCSNMESLPSIVTASMDRLSLSSNKSLQSNQDLQLLASVTATGKSSMNVDLDIATISSNPKSVVTASFTFVARSSSNYQSVAVPKIKPRNNNQKELILNSA